MIEISSHHSLYSGEISKFISVIGSMVNRTILEARVKDVEKRKYPSKHYVYVIYVTWSDSTASVIYRRYSKFFSFQCKLLDSFPKEAGQDDPSKRMIPFIPGKIFFGRSHVQRVAKKRSSALDEYCKALIRLPGHISESPLMLNFFETTVEDLNPPSKSEGEQPTGEIISEPLVLDQYSVIADYQKQRPNEANLAAGTVVDVIEKKVTGWWFVNSEEEQGWVPGSYLEPTESTRDLSQRAQLGQEETYVCVKAYTAINSDEVNLEKGVDVLVIEKNLEGWWKVRVKGNEGWAPAAYLVKPGTLQAQRLQQAKVSPPVEIVSSLLNVSSQSASQAQKVEISKSPVHNRRPPPPRKGSIQRQKPPRPAPPSVGKEYLTIAEFTDVAGDGISFKQGMKVKVLEKSNTGWWFVEIDGNEGWAPSSYLEEKKQQPPLRPPAPKRPNNSSSQAKTAKCEQQNTKLGLHSETTSCTVSDKSQNVDSGLSKFKNSSGFAASGGLQHFSKVVSTSNISNKVPSNSEMQKLNKPAKPCVPPKAGLISKVDADTEGSGDEEKVSVKELRRRLELSNQS